MAFLILMLGGCPLDNVVTKLGGGDSDSDSAINAGVTEVCDGIDNDCDGEADNTTAHLVVTVSIESGEASDGDGVVHSKTFEWTKDSECDARWYFAANGEASIAVEGGVAILEDGCVSAANPGYMTACWWVYTYSLVDDTGGEGADACADTAIDSGYSDFRGGGGCECSSASHAATGLHFGAAAGILLLAYLRRHL